MRPLDQTNGRQTTVDKRLDRDLNGSSHWLAQQLRRVRHQHGDTVAFHSVVEGFGVGAAVEDLPPVGFVDVYGFIRSWFQLNNERTAEPYAAPIIGPSR